MRIVNKKLLKSFRGIRCEWCRWRVAIHAAHLYHTGMGGKKGLDISINLCGLCCRCHAFHHGGARPTLADLLLIVSKREQVDVETIIYRVRLLQRLSKDSERPVWA